MLAPELLENRTMRAITCAVIMQVKKDIRNGDVKKIVEIIRWLKQEDNYWFDCLDVFCGVDCENVKNILLMEARARVEKLSNPNPRQLRFPMLKIYVNKLSKQNDAVAEKQKSLLQHVSK